MSAGDLALWLGALAFVGALCASRTARRMIAASVVAIRYAGRGVWLRLHGRRSVAAALVRGAFEELGPTYIKLGQIVASSHGLFPRRYVEEFQGCLDRVRPFSFAAVQAILREDLGAGFAERFAEINPDPLASASIAQVHAARTSDGRDVVIKVQRPKVREQIDADVVILRAGARVLGALPLAELANPVAIVEDFDATLHEELDFQREAANMTEFNRIIAALGHRDIVAPRVLDELTTQRVLTMERFRGVRIDDVAAVHARTRDPEGLLVRGLQAWFQCMLLHGFFHGDVHAGNLMLLDDGRLGFLDFGIIGRFDRLQRRMVTEYIVAFVTANYRRLGEVMVEMGSVGGTVDLDSLATDLAAAYGPWLAMSFADLKYSELLPSVLRVATKHRMRLPREFVLVTKQMLYFDRYAKLLAPKLNLFTDPRLIAALTADVTRARAQA